MKTTNLGPSAGVLTLALALAAPAAFAQSDLGKRFASEKTTYQDPVTGVTVTVLTAPPHSDQAIYQTHARWAADGKHILFSSNRAGEGPVKAYAVNEETGDIIQIMDAPGSNARTLNIARLSNKVYFLRSGGGAEGNQTQVIELNSDPLFADSAAGTMKEPAAYERVVGLFPVGYRDSGGFGLDAEEKAAYFGVRRPPGATGGEPMPNAPAEAVAYLNGTLPPPPAEAAPVAQNAEAPRGQRGGRGGRGGAAASGVPRGYERSGIIAMDLTTGEVRTVLETAFTMGHVQTNPWVPGEIIYCHETGGDSPQRMWTIKADGTGNRPLYPESPDEWVTHEAVITPDEVAYNILGHQARLRAKPTGLAVVNLRDHSMKLYGQVSAGQAGSDENGQGFWHINGSPDGRWLASDTFSGNIWLIDRVTGKMRQLTTGHRMQPDHAHPSFSPESDRILIQSGRLSDAQSLDLMVIKIPEEWKASAP